MLGLVVAGGVLGVALRELLLLPFSTGQAGADSLVLPAATMGVNVVGSFALGIVIGRLGDRHPLARAFIGTGVLGGFTTYSAFAVQTAVLLGVVPWAGDRARGGLGAARAGRGSARSAPDAVADGGRRRIDLRRSGGRAVNGWVFVAAALAGGIGAGLRYIVDVLVVGGRPGRLPLGILVVNITGSFALGVLTGLGAGLVGTDLAWVVGVGLLGGYTTFSTVSAESVLLMRAGETRRGWMNALITLGLGVAAGAAGLFVGGLF